MHIAHRLSRLAFARLLVAAFLLAAAAGAQAQTQKGPILKAGEILRGGEALTSRNGKFSASFSPEGNFIVYQGAQPLWSTGTGRRASSPYAAAVFTDGSFAIAGTGANGASVALYDSKSGGKPVGNYFLHMGDDGFLTLYIGTDPSQPAGALWRSGGTTVAGTLATPLSAQFPVLSAAQRAQLSPAQLAAYDGEIAGIRARAEAAAVQKAAADATAAKAAADAAAAQKAAAEAAALAPRTFLQLGAQLPAGRYLVSPNKAFFTILKPDGDFGVYRGSGPADNKGLVWSANSKLPAGGRRVPPEFILVVSEAGTIAVAEKVLGGANQIWSSTNRFPAAGNYFAALHDDGSLRVHLGTEPANRSGTVWTSATGDVALPFAEFSSLSAAQAAALTPMQLTQVPRALAATIAEQVEPYKAMGSMLRSNTSTALLKVNEYLTSPAKSAFAILQRDGNFVVYKGSGPADNKGVIWNAATYGRGTSGPSLFYEVGLAQDGVLSVYANRAALWSSTSTRKANGNYFVFLHDDGQLATYYGTAPDNQSGLVWSNRDAKPPIQAAQVLALTAAQSAALTPDQQAAYKAELSTDAARAARYAEQNATAGSIAKANAEKAAIAEAARLAAEAKDKAEAAAMQKKRVDDAAAKAQTDAAYILANTYRHSGEALTAGQELMSLDLARNFYAVMQDDGNLVIFALGNGNTLEERRRTQKQTWSSGTGGRPRGAYAAVMQDDGNLVIYAPNKSAVWSSSSGANKPRGNYYVRLGATGQLLISMGLDTSRSYIPLWTSGGGVIKDPLPIERFPPTPEQRAWLSPGQIAWAVAWAPTAEQHAELVRQQNLEVALIRAKNEEAMNLARWKADVALFEKTRGVYCPDQLSDDRVAGQGRSDTEPLTNSTKRLGDTMATTTIRTRNCLPVAVWITIHDVTKTFVKDGGCVPPHQLKDWQGGNLMAGIYFVRAEILQNTDCKSPAVDSTRIEADVNFNYLGAAMSFDILQDVKNKNYYWEHPVKVGKGTISSAGKMFTDLGEETGITDAMKKAWNLITGNCAIVAQYMPNPLTPFMKAAEAYGPPALQAGGQCYDQGLESFYCQFPAELGRIVSGGSDNSSKLPKLAEQLWNESKTQECRYFYALTPVIPGAPMFCAMSKLVVEDAKKAVQCAIAAERTGAVKELLAGAHSFPSEEACRGMGEVAFKVAMKVATGGKDKAGGSTLKATVQEFRSIYKAAGAGATALAKFEKTLATYPACRD